MHDPHLLPVIYPQEGPAGLSERVHRVLMEALSGVKYVVLTTAEETWKYFQEAEPPAGRFRPVLFVIALGKDGVNLEYMRLLRLLRRERSLLDGCADGVIVGSAIVKLIAKHGKDCQPAVEFVRSLAESPPPK